MPDDAINSPHAASTRSSNPASNPGSPPCGSSRSGHEGGFVQPSSYLRPRGISRPSQTLEKAVDRDERQALVSRLHPSTLPDPIRGIKVFKYEHEGTNMFCQSHIRDFLKNHTSYDVLPLSFRLIVFDTSLSVKESLNILIQNG